MYLGNVTVFSGNVTLTVELLLEKNSNKTFCYDKQYDAHV